MIKWTPKIQDKKPEKPWATTIKNMVNQNFRLNKIKSLYEEDQHDVFNEYLEKLRIAGLQAYN